jgi:hypothetical protein
MDSDLSRLASVSALSHARETAASGETDPKALPNSCSEISLSFCPKCTTAVVN